MDFGKQYLEYAKELWGRQVIQEPWGFATYDVNEGHIYIADMYIDPEVRSQGFGKILEARIIDTARQAGCNFMTCKVHKSDENWTKNLNIYIDHCGYNVLKETNDFISLIKQIGGRI